MDGQVVGFVCSNTRNFTDSSRHYWFVEIEDGALRYVFDSLKGLQRLSQDLAKKLFVTGVLLVFGPRKSSVLRTSELDAAAGVLPQIVRAPNPIRVLGRQRASKVRNFLCRAHGVTKRRHIPAKHHKASIPLKHGKPKESKALLAGAVTQPAKGNRASLKSFTGNRPSTTSRGRSTTIKKVKHIPPQGQIDALFRQQLGTGSDTPAHQPHRSIFVEDISDEEFEKNEDRQLLQPENTALVSGMLYQQETAGEGVVQNDYGPPASTEDTISRTDPIEDFSHDKKMNPHSQPAAVNSLPSPVKHKRNTERAAGNQAVLTGKLAIRHEETKQPISNEQEPCTTELVQEGSMSGNSKKQRAVSCDENDAPCPGDDRANEETTRAESLQGPN